MINTKKKGSFSQVWILFCVRLVSTIVFTILSIKKEDTTKTRDSKYLIQWNPFSELKRLSEVKE